MATARPPCAGRRGSATGGIRPAPRSPSYRQLAFATEHAAAETADLTALLADLRGLLAHGSAPATVSAAVEVLGGTRDNAALCRLIEAVYGARAALGEARFAALLGRIRQTLRRSVDRRMAVAG